MSLRTLDEMQDVVDKRKVQERGITVQEGTQESGKIGLWGLAPTRRVDTALSDSRELS